MADRGNIFIAWTKDIRQPTNVINYKIAQLFFKHKSLVILRICEFSYLADLEYSNCTRTDPIVPKFVHKAPHSLRQWYIIEPCSTDFTPTVTRYMDPLDQALSVNTSR